MKCRFQSLYLSSFHKSSGQRVWNLYGWYSNNRDRLTGSDSNSEFFNRYSEKQRRIRAISLHDDGDGEFWNLSWRGVRSLGSLLLWFHLSERSSWDLLAREILYRSNLLRMPLNRHQYLPRASNYLRHLSEEVRELVIRLQYTNKSKKGEI